MTIREPDCVVLKRRGTQYVANLLSGKSEKQQLEFWRKRTNDLIKKQKANKSTSFSNNPCPKEKL